MRMSVKLHFLVGSTVKMINDIRQTYVTNYFIILLVNTLEVNRSIYGYSLPRYVLWYLWKF
jgi:hypothetical protein